MLSLSSNCCNVSICCVFPKPERRFFGPLLGALVAYLGRSVIGGSNQYTLASALDAMSPLHPREVAALGFVNRVLRGAWEAATGAILRAMSAHLAARFSGGRASEADFKAATALQPSEVAAALGARAAR